MKMMRSSVRPVFQASERQIRAIIKVGHVRFSIVPLVHVSNCTPDDPTVTRKSKRGDEGDPLPVGRRDVQLGPDLARMERDDVVDEDVAVTVTASDVDGVAQSRHSDAGHATLTTTAAASLALKIADRDVEAGVAGKTDKRSFDDFIFNVFAESESESENEPTAAAAVGRRKRSRRDDDDDDDDDDEPVREARRPVNRRTRPPRSTRRTRGAQRPTPPNDTKLVTNRVRRGKSLVSGGWQVMRILGEEQTDAGFKYKVIAGKGRETRTVWRYWTDLDPEVLEGLLKGFKAEQRSMRHKARGEKLQARWTPQ